MKTPYQPFLFRLLHGLQAITVILALITALWTYNTYDGRWFKLPLPDYQEIEGIHGTFGLWVLLLLPLFILYAFNRGEKRLFNPENFSHLCQINKPIFWITLHRLCNTIALFSLTFAVFSGKMMDEKWLPQGQLNHNWYYVHLFSWVVVILVIFWHFLMSLKVGGMPLILSVFQSKYKTQDSPKLWKNHLIQWWQNFNKSQIKQWWKTANQLKYVQILLLAIICLAWIVSIIKENQ